VEAVKGIDFYVEAGTLFAFLGPNGAGKTTTIDILCTLLKPDAGEVTVGGLRLGSDDAKIRSSIGVVFQSSLLDPLLSTRENLMFRGSFYGLTGTGLKEAVDHAIQSAGAEDFKDRPYGKLSGGQRRRADIARALVNTPRVLFLDEPTTGLDPQTRRNVWDTVHALQKECGVTVFLTTHYMEEAASADYVAVIDNGLIAAKGTPAELKEQYSSDHLRLTASDERALLEVLDRMHVQYSPEGGAYFVKLKKTMDALPLLEACEGLITGFEVFSGSMDDAFIGITGKEIR
jgi:multidrug/hemolysin transport system ATP-binding protein